MYVAITRAITVLSIQIWLLSILGDVNAASKHFHCRKGNQTILLEHSCDGKFLCDDKSDEITRNNQQELYNQYIRCDNNQHNETCQILRQSICAGTVVCQNVTPCDFNCSSHYRCKSPFLGKPGKCVSRDTICNGNSCDGCEEDHGWENGVGFKCLRNEKECIIPQQLLYDDVADCDGGVDLCFTKNDRKFRSTPDLKTNSNFNNCYTCLDDSMVIPSFRVCDGIIDCSDLSDECLCDEKPSICEQVTKYGKQAPNDVICDVGFVKCGDDKCIPRTAVCDGIKNCENDEKFDFCRGTIFCSNATQLEEKCRCDTMCRNSYGAACDGIADCSRITLTDEQKKIFTYKENNPVDECLATCPNKSTSISCTDSHLVGVPKPPQRFECETSSGTSVVQLCNGIVECRSGDDESEEMCSDRFKCEQHGNKVITVSKTKICNGIKDCSNGNDESHELCGESRFFCASKGNKKANFDPKIVCDGVITCDDGSDELNCQDGRFYCESQSPLFVTASEKFDGRGDCSDWSDECPTINQSSSTNSFSSRYELIANPILRVFVWIMGLAALFGNAIVIYRESKALRMRQKRIWGTAVANKFLVLNLAASDILMGFYLLGVGGAGLAFQGEYCSVDREWRSSANCSILGVLSVLSSEASVVTMAWMTFCRLHCVIRPFESSTFPSKRSLAAMIFSSWTIAFTIAGLPLIQSLGTIFGTMIEFEYNPYTDNALCTIDETRNMFKDLLTFDLKDNMALQDGLVVDDMTLPEMEHAARYLFRHNHFQIKSLFGYYSTASVCIPKFFTTQSDPAWSFSLAINLFNFSAFLFVVIAYSAMYTRSQRHSVIRSDDRMTSDLQKKILRLILTDFCCWIPICIMAFAKLAGADVSDNAYVFAAIVLLPINSALNPVLYSDLPDFLCRRVRTTFRRQRAIKTSQNPSSMRESKQTLNTALPSSVPGTPRSPRGMTTFF